MDIDIDTLLEVLKNLVFFDPLYLLC